MKWAQVEIPIGGLDQYTDAPHVVSGKVLELENARFRKPPSLAKRYGFTSLTATDTDGNALTTIARAIANDEEFLVCTAKKLYSYSEKADRVADRGFLSECHVDRTPAYGEFSTQISDASTITVNNVTVFAWDGFAARNNVVIFDELTGTIVTSQALDFTSCPKFFAIGNTIYLLGCAADNAASFLNRYALDTTATTLAFGAATAQNLTTSVDNDVVDFDVVCDGTNYFVGYASGTAAEWVVDKLNTSFAVVDTHSISLGAGESPIPWAISLYTDAAAARLWVAMGDGDNGMHVKSLVKADFTSAGTSTASATCNVTTRCSMCAISSTSVALVWDEPETIGQSGAVDVHQHMMYTTVAADATLGSKYHAYDTVIGGDPFTRSDGSIYALCQFGSVQDRSTASTSPQETLYLVEILRDSALLTTPRWVATAARAIAYPPRKSGYVPQVYTNSTTARYGVTIKSKFSYAKADDSPMIVSRAGVDRLEFDFTPDKLHSSAKWGRGRFFAGGRPSWYDGKDVTEHGFAWTPEFHGYTSAAGYLENATGKVYLTQTYEHEDANRYIFRSAPSTVWTVSNSVPQALAITITQYQDLTLTARPVVGVPAARLYTYRTLQDAAEPFYRGHADIFGGAVTHNSNDKIGKEATESDAGVQLFDVLYTTGDILDNAGTPPCKIVEYHRERLWLAGTEEPGWVWFSQPYVEGEQPRFNEALRINVGADVTALASLDTTLIAFTEKGIYAIHGDGPPATGGLDIGLSVSLVTSDVGCTDWRSVAVLPTGVVFLSLKGIYMLGRDMSVNWVGAPLNGSLATYTTPMGTAVMPETPEALFLYADSDNRPITYVYNYTLGTWAMDTMPAAELTKSIAPIYYHSATNWVLARCTASAIKVETIGTYNENASPTLHIPVKVTTPWISLNTIQGWQRVRKLLVLLDPAVTMLSNLVVKVGFDYATTYAETHTFTAAEIAALTTAQVEVHLATQQCEAVRFQISDTADLTAGDLDEIPSTGPAIRSLVIEAGIRPPRTMQLDGAAARK